MLETQALIEVVTFLEVKDAGQLPTVSIGHRDCLQSARPEIHLSGIGRRSRPFTISQVNSIIESRYFRVYGVRLDQKCDNLEQLLYLQL